MTDFMHDPPRTVYRMPSYGKARSRQHRMHPGWLAGILAVLIVLAGLGAWFYQYEYGSEHSVTFTIASKDDQASGSNGHRYLIFTTRGETYQDTDAWFHGKVNSSSMWFQLQVGHSYRCTIYGYRVALLSGYPDLLYCKQVQR